jgi:hypothetical protein
LAAERVYQVIHDDAALDQVAVLPASALPRYSQALSVLELVPANGRPYNDDIPAGPMRELVFGAAGEGTITYLLLDREREVHVLVVHWIGRP